VRDLVDGTPPVATALPPALGGEWAAGAVLLRGGPLAGLVGGLVAVAAAVLVPLRLWLPIIVLPVLLVGLALAWRLCLLIPVRPVPIWSAALSVLVAGGETAWAAATHAEQLVLRRDPGSYALYAQWLATRHGLPVDAQLDAFGGAAALAVPGFTLSSPAYYQVLHGGGADVVPQFLVGAPAVFSLGWWVDGWQGLLVTPAVVGGLAVLAVAAVAARLVGPRWAPLAAAALAVSYPVLHAARSTYSEPLALLLMMTAAALVADAVRRPERGGGLALLGGLILGLAGLVRVDTLTEVALLLPVATVLALRRHPVVGPLVAGACAGTVLAAGSALLLARPYLRTISGSLVPLAIAAAVLAISCGLILLAARRRRRRARAAAPGDPDPGAPDAGGVGRPVGAAAGGLGRLAGRAGWIAAAGVLLLGVALITRPLWQTVRQSPDDPGALFVAGLQHAQHLAVDGGRTYAEWSLVWVVWWAGPVVALAAWAGFVALARRAVQWVLSPVPAAEGTGAPPGPGPAGPPWLVPAVVGFGSALLTLWRPGITPDHPWADRRLVPVLLPTFVLVATGVAAWAVRRARRRLPATLLVLGTVTGILALVAPPFAAGAPMALQRTEAGELAAVRSVCAALQPHDVVLAVDNRAFNEWPQVIRGACGRPAAALQVGGGPLPVDQLRSSARRLAELVGSSGGRLVLLASGEDRPPDQLLRDLGLEPQHVTQLVTIEDARVLARPPTGSEQVRVGVWLARWPG
jgi:hypothetical protein